MTTLETLAKYGLKSDVPSIKKRLMEDGYMIMSAEMCIDGGKFEKSDILVIAKVIKFCDLSLLCSLAEKGERYEKAVKEKVESARYTLENVDDDIEERNYYTGRKEMAEELFAELITEAEGE